MANNRLLRAADSDLGDIADYTIAKHGLKQARSYRDGLLTALEMIAENPEIGADQSHIFPALRRFIHESHAILSEID